MVTLALGRGVGGCKEVEVSTVVLAGGTAAIGTQASARMLAAVLAPPSYPMASAPVPQSRRFPDKLGIPETVLEF